MRIHVCMCVCVRARAARVCVCVRAYARVLSVRVCARERAYVCVYVHVRGVCLCLRTYAYTRVSARMGEGERTRPRTIETTVTRQSRETGKPIISCQSSGSRQAHPCCTPGRDRSEVNDRDRDRLPTPRRVKQGQQPVTRPPPPPSHPPPSSHTKRTVLPRDQEEQICRNSVSILFHRQHTWRKGGMGG